MTDELVVVSPLDQALDTENIELLDWIRSKGEESLQQHDISIIVAPLQAMVKMAKMNGLGLACGLYFIKKHWEEYKIDDEFTDYAFVELGLHRHTIDRYVDVWAMYDTNAVPDDFAPRIMQQNIKSQIPIAKAVAQGYEIDDATWEDLADATDYTEVAKIVREVKGREPRKGSMQIFLDRDGTLHAISDGMMYEIGYLNTMEEDDVVEKAVERIVNNSGILRR